MSEKTLLLYQWPTRPVDRLFTKLKIFVKDGLIDQDWKNVFVNRKVGGAVTLPATILKGLKQKGVAFDDNIYSKNLVFDKVYVIKDPRCLAWAIEQKKRGQIKRLIAGPMIVNLPSESVSIIESPEIDTVIFPSEWSRQIFIKHGQSRGANYRVWSLGLDADWWKPGGASRHKLLVYDKNPSPEVRQKVLETLKKRNIQFEHLRAGGFKREEYLARLQQSYGCIFLSHTETQGIAMFEAWSCDVPTLNWNLGEMVYKGKNFEGASSCPYLTADNGMQFKGVQDFESRLDLFLSRIKTFRPREFILKSHTLGDSIERFLEL